jgi:hypothetical protein
VTRALEYPSDSGTARFAPWAPTWLAPIVVAILFLGGWPWARLALVGAAPRVRAALSPAFGLAAIAIASIAVDAAGLRLARTGGLVTLIVAPSLGFLLLAAGSVRRRSVGAAPATT